MEEKAVMRTFNAADWQIEQKYLINQHLHGWKLIEISKLGFYKFEKCSPEDTANMFYLIECNTNDKSKNEKHLSMLKNSGWEYLQDYCGCSYLRKPMSNLKSSDEEIIYAHKERLKFILKKLLERIPGLVIVTVCELMPRFFHLNKPTNFFYFMVLWLLARCFYLYYALFIKFCFTYAGSKKAVSKKSKSRSSED